MATANALLTSACTNGFSCLNEMQLLQVIAQGAMTGGGGGSGGGMTIGGGVTNGTQGSVLFIGPGGTLAQDNANFFWNDTNDRLGLVNNSPVATLDVNGIGAFGDGTEGAPSITFRNDLDCGLWRPGANIVALSTAGAERVRVDDTGKVGIATISPNEILSINGARAALYNTLTSSTNFERLDLEWSANVCRIWTEKGSGGGTARDLVLGVDATERIRISTSTERIACMGSFISLVGTTSESGSFQGLNLGYDNSTEHSWIQSIREDTSHLRTLLINPLGGNVAIGKTAPTAVLHLKAGTATASTAPLKFTAGTNLTAPENGTFEYEDNGTTGHLYFTRNVAGVATRGEVTIV